MDRIIIEHVSGEKANQREVFATDTHRSVLIGRDLSAQVRFGEGSDSVSRQHARLEYDPAQPDALRLVNLGSRNGLFLNGRAAPPEAPLSHQDRLQIGVGGPELVVLFDPAPVGQPKATRLVAIPGATREVPTPPPAGAPIPPPVDAPEPAVAAPKAVGRATVEMLIRREQTQQKRSSTKVIAAVAGGLVLLVAGGFGFMQWQQSRSAAQLQLATSAATATASAATQAAADAAANAASAAAAAQAAQGRIGQAASKEGWEQRIAAQYSGSVVYIEASWRLVHATSRKPVYHRFKVIKANGRTLALPVYVAVSNDAIEPALSLDPNAGPPIGGTHTGTGFIVNSSGFVLTNRHVGASWLTRRSDMNCPCVLEAGKKEKIFAEAPAELQRMMADFVPAQSRQGKFFGENQLLDVTFPNSKNRNAGRLVQVSTQHDVALLRVDVAFDVTPVPLATADEVPSPGQSVLTMGFPGVSPRVLQRTESQDPFNRQAQFAIVPGVSITPGSVSRVINAADSNQVSTMGDVYQLSINATGPGNSGGPVFDNSGKVSGIFFAGNDRLSFAVPIKYGLELLQGGQTPKPPAK